MSHLHREMFQLEKPRANEITEPLAFTVYKLELRGEAILSQSRSRCIRFCGGLFGPGFVLLLIYPRTFLRSGMFQADKRIFGFESMTTVARKQKL